jgi:GNAT superfamily N-acetyltransferase
MIEKNNIGKCRLATESDINHLAHIHLSAFEGFFLSQLGFNFLCVMYRAFLRSPKSIFVVYEANSGNLVGFAVGTLQIQTDLFLALRVLPELITALIPVVFRNPMFVCRRLWRRVIDSRRGLSTPSNAVVLRSICILPSLHGLGVAGSLLHTFESLSMDKGADIVYLTTDEADNERAHNFYFREGYVVNSRFKQDGVRWMWLMSKNLRV